MILLSSNNSLYITEAFPNIFPQCTKQNQGWLTPFNHINRPSSASQVYIKAILISWCS